MSTFERIIVWSLGIIILGPYVLVIGGSILTYVILAISGIINFITDFFDNFQKRRQKKILHKAMKRRILESIKLTNNLTHLERIMENLLDKVEQAEWDRSKIPLIPFYFEALNKAADKKIKLLEFEDAHIVKGSTKLPVQGKVCGSSGQNEHLN